VTIALGVAAWLAGGGGAAAETKFAVDPEVGNNAFTALFDSAIGERITAVSSAVGCTFTVDEAKLEGRGHCSVPLSSIRVDNDDTKTAHFGQWARCPSPPRGRSASAAASATIAARSASRAR